MRMQWWIGVGGLLLVAGAVSPWPVIAAEPADTPAQVSTVVLYTTQGCGYCAQALKWLQARGVAFEQRDIGDPAVAAEFRARGGQGVPHALIGDIAVVGFQPDRYARLLGPR